MVISLLTLHSGKGILQTYKRTFLDNISKLINLTSNLNVVVLLLSAEVHSLLNKEVLSQTYKNK